ncbi:MAG: outer membrane protein transport protein [Candidatus Omnitrophota bacterium]
MRYAASIFFAAFVLLALIAVPAFAAGSGAYRLEVPDAGAVGKGSAFSGEANTPAAVYYNPAGMTQIVGQAISVGLSLVEPHETFKGPNPATPDAVQMKRGDYPIPHFYYVTRLGTENVALGIGTTTAWGLTTEWAPDSFARYVATKTEMLNHDYYVSAAYKLNAQWSVAAGVVIDQSRVAMEKKANWSGFGGADGNIRLAGSDTAAGYMVAAMFKLNDQHQFGFMYRSAIHQQYTGKVHMDGIASALVPGVFPATSYETDVMVKSVLPQVIVFGYSFKPDPKWTVNTDVEWTDWSSTRQSAPTYTSETDPTRLSILETGYPANKDWHSAFSVAMGVEYAATDRLRLRSGYYLHQSPVAKATWDPSMPDSDSLGVTLGSGYDVTKNMTVDLAWSGMIFKTRKVNNAVGDAVGGSIDGSYRQWINLMYATATYKF